jgi:pimeloyl-ACP methyl ester carboxylesterase
MTAVPAQACYLSTGGETSFALLNDASERGDCAVLIVPPFGWDEMCSYRARREWAHELAARGFPTLRIDLPGSGDASGGPRDPGRLGGWTDAVAGAAQWLRERTGCPRVAAIGIGLGGLVTLRAAAHAAPIDELVLWAAPGRGRAYVRTLQAFARLSAAGAGTGAPPAEEEGLSVNGYLLSDETVTDLRAFDAAELELPPRPGRRALLLGRDDDDAADERVREALERSGMAVAVAAGHGYGAMLEEPQQSRTPRAMIAATIEWLEASPATADGTAPVPAPAAAETAAVTAHDVLELPDGVSERPLWFRHGDAQLFGVLAEPNGGADGRLAVVLVNAGPQRHIGPNRMWVEIARRWAASGVPTLRVDLGSIGEAGGEEASYTATGALYAPSFTDEVVASLDAAAAATGAERFVVLGLCSGAYWGLHAAARDERIAAVALLNLRALVFDEFVSSARHARDLRGLALRWETWRRLLRGELDLRRHAATARILLARLVAKIAQLPARIAGRAEAPSKGSQGDLLLDRLRDRDQRLLALFSGAEPLREELEADGWFERLDRWPNLDVVLLGTDVDTHTFQPGWLQRQAHALVDELLEEELRRDGVPVAEPPAVTGGAAGPAAPPRGGRARTVPPA